MKKLAASTGNGAGHTTWKEKETDKEREGVRGRWCSDRDTMIQQKISRGKENKCIDVVKYMQRYKK